jgi:hypothetical protein
MKEVPVCFEYDWKWGKEEMHTEFLSRNILEIIDLNDQGRRWNDRVGILWGREVDRAGLQSCQTACLMLAVLNRRGFPSILTASCGA